MRYVQQYYHYKQQDLIPQQWCLRRLSSSWPSIGRANQWAHPERAWMGLGAEAISGGWPGEKDFQVNRNRYLNWPTYQYIPQLKYIYVIHINLTTYHITKWHLNFESSLKWCVVPSPESSCNCSLENFSPAKDSVSTQSWFFTKKGGIYISWVLHFQYRVQSCIQ